MTAEPRIWPLAIVLSLGIHALVAALLAPRTDIMTEGTPGGAVASVSDIAAVMAIAGHDVVVDIPVEPETIEAVADAGRITPPPTATLAPTMSAPQPPTGAVRPDRTHASDPIVAAAAIPPAPDQSSAPVVDAVQPAILEDTAQLPPLPAPRPWRAVDEERRLEAQRRATERAREQEQERRAERRSAEQREAERERAESHRTAAATARGTATRDAAETGGGANRDQSRAGNDGRADTAGRFDASSYSGRIMTHLRRHQRYPRSARNAGIEGQATVRFTIDRNGAVTAVRLVQSSGHAVLDEATLAMVQRASRFPAIPREAGNSQMTFTAPISYRLR